MRRGVGYAGASSSLIAAPFFSCSLLTATGNLIDHSNFGGGHNVSDLWFNDHGRRSTFAGARRVCQKGQGSSPPWLQSWACSQEGLGPRPCQLERSYARSLVGRSLVRLRRRWMLAVEAWQLQVDLPLSDPNSGLSGRRLRPASFLGCLC